MNSAAHTVHYSQEDHEHFTTVGIAGVKQAGPCL